MQSWFFCIINSVFSVSRFMVCVFISLCVFVCVRDRSLRLLAVWWADQSSRRCSSWLVFLCAVLSDRCQIVVARVLSCSRSLLLVPESEFRRAALSLILCHWPEQSQVLLVVGVSCGVVRSLSVVSCLVLFSVTPPCTWVWFRRAALSLILCRWPEQSQVQFVVGVSVRCCQIVVARVLSCSRVWVWVSPGCSVSDSWRGRTAGLSALLLRL